MKEPPDPGEPELIEEEAKEVKFDEEDSMWEEEEQRKEARKIYKEAVDLEETDFTRYRRSC